MEDKRRILIVDDNRSNLNHAQRILGQEYRITTADSGQKALDILGECVPDLILLDIMMPEMDGFETLERIRTMEPCTAVPVIFLTANTDPVTEARCLSAGAADFIGKPFVPQVLLRRVSHTLEIEMYQKHLESVISAKVDEITRMQEMVITGIANLIESRDNSTGAHVKNTGHYVRILTQELQRRGLYRETLTDQYAEHTIKAAVLHDVGKIKVSDAVLTKPGKLTAGEYEQIKLHTVYGDEIITDIIGDVEDKEYVKTAREIARSHHERWDGKGYPDGLAGERIPLCARIMALADVFDALAAERCYKAPIRPIERVFDMIAENAGTQFDPELARLFCELAPDIIAAMEE